MRERDRGLSDLRKRMLEEFAQKMRLHELYITWQCEVDYRVYVFFVSEVDKSIFLKHDFLEKLKYKITSVLAKIKSVPYSDLIVNFEFDSDGNVQENFEGDYCLLLK